MRNKRRPKLLTIIIFSLSTNLLSLSIQVTSKMILQEIFPYFNPYPAESGNVGVCALLFHFCTREVIDIPLVPENVNFIMTDLSIKEAVVIILTKISINLRIKETAINPDSLLLQKTT